MGYKRYGSSTSVPTFDEGEYEAVTAKLQDMNTAKIIYFGIKKPKSAADSDKPWRELTTDDFDTQITSDTDGCSATITQNTNDLTNKTGIITYTLSKNTTGSARLITFKYNGTVLFKINQGFAYNSENVYICVVPSISNNTKNIWLFAKFNDSLPTPDQLKSSYSTMTQFDPSYTGKGRMLYFSEHTLTAGKTIKELKESGILTAIQENTTFTTNTSYDTDIPYHLVRVNRTTDNTPYNTLSDKSEAFKKEYLMCSIGDNNTVGSYQHKPKFNVFDNSYYYGIYKYT